MDVLRTAVVGVKGVGGGHLKGVAAHPRARLVAVADLDEAAAADLAGPDVPVFADHQAMLAAAKPDAVVIATPHFLHAPMSLAALEAGAHVFVEKPIAMRVSEADRMVDTARRLGRVLAVGHNYRTFPGNLKLKELVDSGRLGRIHRVLWQWLENRPEAYYGRDIWRCTWRHAGGGVLMNQTSHDLDLMCWLFGPPLEVSGTIANLAHRHEVEDTALATVRFAGGPLASIQLSTCTPRLNLRQICGDRAAVHFEDAVNANVNVPEVFRLGTYRDGLRQIIAEDPHPVGQPDPVWEDVDCAGMESPSLLDSFIDACLDGSAPVTDGASARTTLELINAIVLAGIKRRTVTLPVDRAEYDDLLDDLIAGRIAVERSPDR